MLCYQDRTFCSFHKECKKGVACKRALTDRIIANAEEVGLPVARYEFKPDCFKRMPK